MANSKNDYAKHVEAWENHLAALDGGNDGRWTELTAKEVCKLLAQTTLGLNGGSFERMGDAAKIIGFDSNNIVHCDDGTFQVVTLIEFTAGDAATVH
jgi:hypothetical protein